MSIRGLAAIIIVCLLSSTAADAHTYVVVVEEMPRNVDVTFAFFNNYVKDLKLETGVTLQCKVVPRAEGTIGYKIESIATEDFPGVDSVKAILLDGVLLTVEGGSDNAFEVTLGIYPLEEAVDRSVTELRQCTFLVSHEETKVPNEVSFIARTPDEVANVTRDPEAITEVLPDAEVLPDIDEFIEVEMEPEFDYGRLGRMVVYPMLAQRNGIEGQVMVGALIGKDGIVERVQVVKSDAAIFNSFAMKPIILTRFTPAYAAGEPVRTWIRIPIKFTLK